MAGCAGRTTVIAGLPGIRSCIPFPGFTLGKVDVPVFAVLEYLDIRMIRPEVAGRTGSGLAGLGDRELVPCVTGAAVAGAVIGIHITHTRIWPVFIAEYCELHSRRSLAKSKLMKRSSAPVESKANGDVAHSARRLSLGYSSVTVVSTPRSSQTAVKPRTRELSGAVLPWIASSILMVGAVITAWSMSAMASTCVLIMGRMNLSEVDPTSMALKASGALPNPG